MKALILYASKTGASEDVAKYISSKFETFKIVNLTNATNIPNFNDYDKIIIGSGVYFGKIHNDAKKFLTANLDKLENKDFGVYFCCGSADDKKRKIVMDKNYCPQLQTSALAICCAGGKYNYNRAHFPQKIVIYIGIKLSRLNKITLPEIDYKEVDKFVEKIKNISKQEPQPLPDETKTKEKNNGKTSKELKKNKKNKI